MSSHIRKVQDRIEMKNENAWLKRAFRNCMAAFTEQQENSADLARGLWAAAHQNGGELRISRDSYAAMPENGKLRAMVLEDTGETVYIAYVEPLLVVDDTTPPVAEAIARD